MIETTNLDGKPKLAKEVPTVQRFEMSCPSGYGTNDLTQMVKAMGNAFITYNFQGEMLTDGQMTLTINRIDGKPITRGSVFQVRRAWLLCIRGWTIKG